MSTDRLLLSHNSEVFNCIDTLTTEQGEALIKALEGWLEERDQRSKHYSSRHPGNYSIAVGFRSVLDTKEEYLPFYLQWMEEWRLWKDILHEYRRCNGEKPEDVSSWPKNQQGEFLSLSADRVDLFIVSSTFAEDILEQARGISSGELTSTPIPTSEGETPKKKVKTRTRKGEATTRMISGLSLWHKYDGEGCLNLEPVGNNELARMAGCDQSTASDFFNSNFKGGLQGYKRCCEIPGALKLKLRELRGELRLKDIRDLTQLSDDGF